MLHEVKVEMRGLEVTTGEEVIRTLIVEEGTTDIVDELVDELETLFDDGRTAAELCDLLETWRDVLDALVVVGVEEILEEVFEGVTTGMDGVGVGVGKVLVRE